jgi:hypothetical protein
LDFTAIGGKRHGREVPKSLETTRFGKPNARSVKFNGHHRQSFLDPGVAQKPNSFEKTSARPLVIAEVSISVTGQSRYK